MPGSYPPAPPTLSGDLLTIHRLLNTPTQIRRRLRTFEDLRFVSDQILTQRYRSSGGAVLYEVSEPLVNVRAVESVAAGSEYPAANIAEGVAALAAVQKWGQKVFLSDEKIKRSVNGGDEVDRALRKLVNTIISKVDALTLAAIASAVSATQAAAGTWSHATDARMLRDVELAKAKVVDLNLGYKPDAILMSSTKYGYLASDQIIAAMRQRETVNNPVYSGKVDVIGDLTVITTSAANLPTDDVWVIDSQQLGGMADEADVDPGYTVDKMGVQVKGIRQEDRDGWNLQGRRITVPVIQEPGAAIRITGT